MFDRSSIDEIFQDVLAAEPPDNESNTCAWIILPVLGQLGYRPHEIASQNVSVAGTRPDYIVLRGTPHEWVLEAKAWNVPLDHSGAAQAVSYASGLGKRWAVLTNGKHWRLFDCHLVNKPAHDRLVAEATYTEAAFDTVLRALCKPTMLEDATQRVIRLGLLPTALRTELLSPGSEVFNAVFKCMKARFQGLANQELSDAIGQLLHESDGAQSSFEQNNCLESGLATSAEADQVPKRSGDTVEFSMDMAFDYSYTHQPTFTCPDFAVSAPDFLKLTKRVLAEGVRRGWTLPEDMNKPSGIYFTRDAAVAKDRMGRPALVEGSDVWYETRRSANNHVRMIVRVLKQNGQDAKQFSIRAVRYKGPD